ncbi:MAG: thioredoxin family protein [Phycisphaerales bacterium]|nr:thioredoxin family protein [Phycisphaerales bacterium]
MLTPEFLRGKFGRARPYRDYIATGTPGQRDNWARAQSTIHLTADQADLVGGFVRRMPVLVISGTWCGDCVQQGPMLAAIAAANPGLIDLRFLDRDENSDLAEQVRICGGLRVPTAIFMNEEFEFVSLLGDRTLSRYRAIASEKLGAACPLPGAPLPPDQSAATLQDWVNEFERVHLLLRLSPNLRERHQD